MWHNLGRSKFEKMSSRVKFLEKSHFKPLFWRFRNKRSRSSSAYSVYREFKILSSTNKHVLILEEMVTNHYHGKAGIAFFNGWAQNVQISTPRLLKNFSYNEIF